MGMWFCSNLMESASEARISMLDVEKRISNKRYTVLLLSCVVVHPRPHLHLDLLLSYVVARPRPRQRLLSTHTRTRPIYNENVPPQHLWGWQNMSGHFTESVEPDAEHNCNFDIDSITPYRPQYKIASEHHCISHVRTGPCSIRV